MTPRREGTRSTNRIVVGIDASDNSRAALRWTIAFAQPGDTIELVHAWDANVIVGLEAPHLDPTTAEARADQLVRDTADEVFEDEERQMFELVFTTPEGRASQSLIDVAADADLLVVGRRGLGSFRSLLLGSVSGDVVHHARCPVIVIPPASAPDGATEGERR